jgi:membrane-bound lytic murein transglycosylase
MEKFDQEPQRKERNCIAKDVAILVGLLILITGTAGMALEMTKTCQEQRRNQEENRNRWDEAKNISQVTKQEITQITAQWEEIEEIQNQSTKETAERMEQMMEGLRQGKIVLESTTKTLNQEIERAKKAQTEVTQEITVRIQDIMRVLDARKMESDEKSKEMWEESKAQRDRIEALVKEIKGQTAKDVWIPGEREEAS